MENSNFLIIAAAALIATWLHVFWMHRKLNNYIRDVSNELSDTFLDYIKISEQLEDLQEMLEKNQQNNQSKPNAGGEEIFKKSLFIKKSLFNLDIPKNKNVSPEALQELFDNLIQQRWWKKPRNED